MWATWCHPCTHQQKHLKEIIDYFEGSENLIFVSVSIDKKFEKWKNYVEENMHNQYNLFVPYGWDSQFYKHFENLGIPRFILLSSDGKIVKANLNIPSDEEAIPELIYLTTLESTN